MYLFYNHISAFFTRSKPSGAGLIGRGGTRSSVDGPERVQAQDLMALFRRHSSVPEIMPVQLLKQIFHHFIPQKTKSGGPIGLSGLSQKPSEAQMGAAKRMHISQRMSQHIMLLKLD